MNIVFKVHLKFYKWKNFTIQLNLEKFQGRLSCLFRRNYGNSVHISNIRPNFDETFGIQFLGGQTFLDQHFVRPKFLGSKIIWTRNSSWIHYVLDWKLLWIQDFILAQIFFDQHYFWSNIFWVQNFLKTQCLRHKISLHPNLLGQFSWGLTQLKLILSNTSLIS